MSDAQSVSYAIEVFEPSDYPRLAADYIAERLPSSGSVVLTGGTTAEKVYPYLALHRHDWAETDVLFSDERCVPPDDPASNFKMANDLLLKNAFARVHRMRGEDRPQEAAAGYHEEIAGLVERGLDLVLLGMGADAHIGAMFPSSPALQEKEALCAAVDRPDGMSGLTLTPPAVLAGKKFLLLVTGTAKADTVRRVIESDEGIESCPARLLADCAVTLVLDEAAAAALTR